MKTLLTRKSTWMVAALLACLGAVGYWQRAPLQAWYLVRQLSAADADNRDACAVRVAALEEAAVPRLLDGLHDADPQVCANLQMPLCMIAHRWGPHDPRSLRLAEHVRDQFNGYSAAGQEKAVGVLTSLVHLERRVDGGAEMQEEPPPSLPAQLTTIVGEVLMTAEQIDHLRPGALLLAAELIDGVQPGQWVDIGRDMAERGMKDPTPAVRASALHLLGRKPMRKDQELLKQAVALLHDPEAVVRKAALVALASEAEAVRDEALLPLLHDASEEVQYWCEIVLRKRGRTDDDIQRARMITDKNPATRLRVILGLRQGQDINVGAWLLQLSHDPSPMVRAAAVRAAGDHPQVDFAERLREIAERDPSATVRQNAQFYLQQQTPRTRFEQNPLMRLEALGDQAVLAYCDDEPAATRLTARIRRARPGWCIDVVQAYVSVAVFYDFLAIDFEQACTWLTSLDDAARVDTDAVGTLHRIPCCYAMGLDFDAIERHTGLGPDAVIELHCSATFTVYAIGFCPGFPYLGYLPSELTGVPRLASPRLRVEQGSVGLTGRQTGIYTEARPGGWNIIGRTPLELVNVKDGYFPLRTGDRVQFHVINEDEYGRLLGSRL